jgi:transcriptional accessory protein Tex/SPT6
VLRSDVLSLDDLQTGARLAGTVRNVVDFGAFIDIGVKQDGLLHRTRLPRGVVLSPGEVIEVEVSSIDKERNRISLTWPRAQADGEQEGGKSQESAEPAESTEATSSVDNSKAS